MVMVCHKYYWFVSHVLMITQHIQGKKKYVRIKTIHNNKTACEHGAKIYQFFIHVPTLIYYMY